MHYYQFHLFFCVNERLDGRKCCFQGGAAELKAYAKEQVKLLGFNENGKRVRITTAGCMGRCQEGPVLVIYPEGIWYRINTKTDIDLILEQHLGQGIPVLTLQI